MSTRKEKPLIPLKTYAPPVPMPKVRALPTDEEAIGKLRAKVAELTGDLERAKDRIRRLREVIESEVKFWEKGLQTGEWEGIEATRRRLSRLRGSLAYLGIAGFGREEDL